MWFSSFIFKNLFRRKVRSLLTATGIAVAIGAMVALLGITDGFRKSALANFEKHGVDLLVTSGNADQLSSSLPENLGEQIRRIPGVQDVYWGLLEFSGECRSTRGNNQFTLMVQGLEPGSIQFNDMKLLRGRMLEPGDRRKALLGPLAASTLQVKLGDSIVLSEKAEPYEVVGVAEGVSVYENKFITVPLREMQEDKGMEGRVTGFSVILDQSEKNPALVELVQYQIESLRGPKGKPVKISVQETRDYVNGMVHIRVAQAMAWLISIVAVLIGAIGMLNTMIMSVLERIKEIGILRAVGWRKSRVMRMVLGESILLSLTGAVLGVVGALVLTHLLTRLPSVNGFISGEITPLVLAEGFLFAVGVGLLGGLYPAWRASRLLPTEAVRHE